MRCRSFLVTGLGLIFADGQSRARPANGVSFEQLIFPDEIHDLLLHHDWLRSYLRAQSFSINI